jgi:hypothetical protein
MFSTEIDQVGPVGIPSETNKLNLLFMDEGGGGLGQRHV